LGWGFPFWRLLQFQPHGGCFLARTVLGWSARKLAKVAGVSAYTVANFERGGALKTSTVEVIQRTLEKAGITIDANDGGPGARLRGHPRPACSALRARSNAANHCASMEPVTLRIPPETWERIEQLMQAERRPLQNMLRNLIDDGIAAQQSRDKPAGCGVAA
jgi:transcriptional regulator with XRE-family HTH domain